MQDNIKMDSLCIVDDEIQVIKALNRELKDYAASAGFNIKTYTSPKTCLEELKTNSSEVSVIISDLRMPEMKGSDFFMEVHRDFPEIELMMLTAYNDMPEIQKAISASIGSLLTKPWEPEKLQQEIQRAREQYFKRKDDKTRKEQLNNQLELAGDFQKRLLQTETPQFKGADLNVSYLPYPHLKLGGDYYDVVPLDDERFYMLIGDVSGHGIRPSMVTAILKVLSMGFYQELKEKRLSPAEFLNNLNPKLCYALQNSSDLLITFSCLLVNIKERSVVLSNAGHLPLYQVKKNVCIPHKVEGPALGFMPGIEYSEKEILLDEGDVITMLTDGLLESAQEHKKIRDNIVQRVLVEALSSQDYNQAIIDKLKFMRGIKEFHDDVTIMSVKV